MGETIRLSAAGVGRASGKAPAFGMGGCNVGSSTETREDFLKAGSDIPPL
jgi:hypothetical protein